MLLSRFFSNVFKANVYIIIGYAADKSSIQNGFKRFITIFGSMFSLGIVKAPLSSLFIFQ